MVLSVHCLVTEAAENMRKEKFLVLFFFAMLKITSITASLGLCALWLLSRCTCHQALTDVQIRKRIKYGVKPFFMYKTAAAAAAPFPFKRF